MKSLIKSSVIVLLVTCSVGIVMPIHASADENLKRGLAKAQYMLRQANVEKSEIAKKLQEEKKVAEEQEAALKGTERDLKKAQKRIAKLSSTIELWQKEYESLKNTLSETRIELAKTESKLSQKDTLFQVQTDNFALCETHNKDLVSLGYTLLDAYEGKSVSDALKQNDPFFGLKQVEVENLVQEYRHKIEDLSLIENAFLLNEIELPVSSASPASSL